MDKFLEARLHNAIIQSEEGLGVDGMVTLTIKDAKRLLYRMKQENSKIPELVYRKDVRNSRKKVRGRR